MTSHQFMRAGLHPADAAALERAAGFLRGYDTRTALARLLPALPMSLRDVIGAHTALTHAAVMVFPSSPAALREALAQCGFVTGTGIPSTVVRERVARRHGLAATDLDVTILLADVSAADGRTCHLEIFALPDTGGARHHAIAARERAEHAESHVAFEVANPDTVVLSGLRALLTGPGALHADGGGYNQHQDRTVLYFRAGGDAHGPEGPSPRIELIAPGPHPDVLDAHLRPDAQAAEPARHLLELLTGAWATQAIAVAAELGIADHLPTAEAAAGKDKPSATDKPSAARLAERVGADPDGLRRLLRYLAALGLLVGDPDGYALSATGQLLRDDAEGSMRALALLYGGPFYRSFAELPHSVRTGGDGFAKLHGRDHFEHFARDPELAELFDRAMASSTAMFAPVPDLVDLSAAEVVVDVAGGTGELLARLLERHPHVYGVLFERPHLGDAAAERMRAAGCADRWSFVTGDFTEAVPHGADVYILSRVLHDWDDERCVTILRRCADAMREDAQLLVLERLLPEDDRPSLAPAWDVHMLCNVGGRERTSSHYRRLLADAGFALTHVSALPLDGFLLHARRTAGPDALEASGPVAHQQVRPT